MAKLPPQNSLEAIEPQAVQQIVHSLQELNALGKPQSDDELEQRIKDYFALCEHSSIRPGIESLCMALHISRTTLFRWNNGSDCSEHRTEIIQNAKSFIAAFMEQSVLNGKINPASGIFIMKNWLSYKDTESFEDRIRAEEKRQPVTIEELEQTLAELKEI